MPLSDSVVILYNELSVGAAIDELDVLDQVDAVAASLRHSGYSVSCLPLSRGTGGVAKALLSMKPQLVFNLVEAVASEGKLSYLAPTLLEELGLRFTGSSAETILLTTDKIATKRVLQSLDIATPAWVSLSEAHGFVQGETYIIKAIYEDASVGIGQESLVALSSIGEARRLLMDRRSKSSRELFAERYVDGREISVSILGEGGRPMLLPPSEISFIGYAEKNLAKIVDYRAKWDVDSYEYQHTIPMISSRPEDRNLIEDLKALAVRCWDEFGLRGYARIDFRVDRNGKPWVLEINANPCLTPGESGFVQSARASGLAYHHVIARILLEAAQDFSDGCDQAREKGAS